MVMMHPPPSVRDLSYASAVNSRSGRAVVRLMENTTGRIGLIKRAQGYEGDLARGANFFDVMVARYGLTLDVARGAMEAIPRSGPLIMIANHPYGILDGIMMGHLLSRTRGDFRIMANAVFSNAPKLEQHLLPELLQFSFFCRTYLSLI